MRLETYTSFTPVFAHLQTIDVVWMPTVVTIKRVLPWMSVRSEKHIWNCLRCTVSNLKKNTVEIKFHFRMSFFEMLWKRQKTWKRKHRGKERGGGALKYLTQTRWKKYYHYLKTSYKILQFCQRVLFVLSHAWKLL